MIKKIDISVLMEFEKPKFQNEESINENLKDILRESILKELGDNRISFKVNVKNIDEFIPYELEENDENIQNN